ncbi:MAG: hypothetical protein O3A46_01785 [Candidatus Poribacteria bacterium]|nr:hypothetical protein [Candidatus Poribacteria bacterium]
MDNRPRAQWMWVSVAVAVALGFLAVGALAAVGLIVVFFASVVPAGVVAQALGGAAIIVGSVALGALCGVLVGAEAVREDTFIAILVVGACVIGAGAGAVGFMTRAVGTMTLAGLFGIVGAVVAAWTASRLYPWLTRSANEIPTEIRRLLS